MTEPIDFTHCKRVPNRAYNGANGKKIAYVDFFRGLTIFDIRMASSHLNCGILFAGE